jgi:hypothetical protein
VDTKNNNLREGLKHSHMKIALITICTNRKKALPTPQMCATSLPKGDQGTLSLKWKNRVQNATDSIPAKNLYSGRGFSEVRKTRQSQSVGLWVISAGLGLICGDRKVPAYNLTISPKAKDAIQNKIIPNSDFCPRQWWSDLNQALYGTSEPISDLISNHSDTTFVITLSQAYADLIHGDLLSLPLKDLQRVRIVGLCSQNLLPKEIQHLWMPYDERFDGPNSPNPGTRADFPQRVARHFVEEILPLTKEGTPQEHARAVTVLLAPMRSPDRIKRDTKNDDQIKTLIIERWDDARGSANRMLRILRDEENTACEQGRLAELFRQIKLRRI